MYNHTHAPYTVWVVDEEVDRIIDLFVDTLNTESPVDNIIDELIMFGKAFFVKTFDCTVTRTIVRTISI